MKSLMNKQLAILLACVAVVTMGVALALPVLPFYISRMALAEGASPSEIAFHVGFLTGIFAFMQFVFAPLWGAWSDRIGRRLAFLIGLGGYAISLVFFGIGTDLMVLYLARIVGGILSAAVLPTASAYVADVTDEAGRGRGMAWLASAVSFGFVVGPALGALLVRLKWYITWTWGPFAVDDFSTPFIVAALLATATLVVALRLLPEPVALPTRRQQERGGATGLATRRWHTLKAWSLPQEARSSLTMLLFYSFLGSFSLALFEGTFALHAQRVMRFTPAEMGAVFMVCGLVMAVAQASIVGNLFDRFGEHRLLPLGFGLMGVALLVLMIVRTMMLILVSVAFLALGMAIIIPALSSLVSKRPSVSTGKVLGIQAAVNSLGQATGPMIGGFLFAWYLHVPYLIAALPLLATATMIATARWGQPNQISQ